MRKISYTTDKGDVVTGYIVHDHFAVRKVGRFWQVDHVPTGMHMGRFNVTTRAEIVRRFERMLRDTQEINPCHEWGYSDWRDLLHRGINEGYGHAVFAAARAALTEPSDAA